MSQDHRSAEQRARQVLLMCAQTESFRRVNRPDSNGEQCHGDAKKEKEPYTDEEENSLPSRLELMRKALQRTQETASIKYNKLELEHSSLKLELVNAKFELEQANLKVRQANREKEALRGELDALVMNEAESAKKLVKENADMARMLETLRVQRNVARVENVRLRKLLVNQYVADKSAMLSPESEHGPRGGSCASTETGSTTSDLDDSFDAQSPSSRVERGDVVSPMNGGDRRRNFQSWSQKFARSTPTLGVQDANLPPLREVQCEVQCVQSSRQLLLE